MLGGGWCWTLIKLLRFQGGRLFEDGRYCKISSGCTITCIATQEPHDVPKFLATYRGGLCSERRGIMQFRQAHNLAGNICYTGCCAVAGNKLYLWQSSVCWLKSKRLFRQTYLPQYQLQNLLKFSLWSGASDWPLKAKRLKQLKIICFNQDTLISEPLKLTNSLFKGLELQGVCLSVYL